MREQHLGSIPSSGKSKGERKMTSEQEEHLLALKREFISLVDVKYREGQKEHGGDLQDMSSEDLLNCSIAEAIDQVVYLLTLKSKIKK